MEAKNNAKNINLADCIEHLAILESVIILNNHENSFSSNSTSRLINF